jgi:hypothetical protein
MIDDIDTLNEGFLNRVTLGLKIKPHMDTHEILKKHSYPGFVDAINKTNDIEDLKYLKKDCNYACNEEFKKIKDRIAKCKKLGKCKETQNYYDGIYRMYINKGVTEKDCEATIKWYKEKVIPLINNRIKEVRI